MAKKKAVSSKRQPVAPSSYDGKHPGGVSNEEIEKVISEAEECFKRQSEFFSRMEYRPAGRHHKRSH